ncbi:lysophospholipid acyltransferase family protein [Frigidibacter sp. RF13]|uniref:lysophospholipid acyltransferase family protein n=1 Tax=Frigidibacter sp. RF13 TaxID=2997340 RepID=UPI00226FFFB5|nr:lysophospholipid acyltransferase family protein [Frigidibacter sp. RF13]MCY1125883.1 lysophospholipid acyltransferase family protein [Frigidibacter sp. RF13]
MSRDRSRAQIAVDYATNLALRGLIGLSLALPYRMRVVGMGWLMRRVIGPMAGYRARALANLAFIWPEMPEAERRRIADAACDNAGRALIENYSTRDLMRRMEGVEIRGPGLAALEAARDTGRPVILVSGHFGNYEAARAALVGRGYHIGGLYRPMRNGFFNEHYVRTMEAFGGPVFPQGTRGTAGFVRHLKAGGQLVLLFDQNVVAAPFLDFLGEPAATATSAAELALRYDALLIPFFATRKSDGISFDIELEAPVPCGSPKEMTQHLNDGLAARVQRDPGQWFWIHRRWKHPNHRAAGNWG